MKTSSCALRPPRLVGSPRLPSLVRTFSPHPPPGIRSAVSPPAPWIHLAAPDGTRPCPPPPALLLLLSRFHRACRYMCWCFRFLDSPRSVAFIPGFESAGAVVRGVCVLSVWVWEAGLPVSWFSRQVQIGISFVVS